MSRFREELDKILNGKRYAKYVLSLNKMNESVRRDLQHTP